MYSFLFSLQQLSIWSSDELKIMLIDGAAQSNVTNTQYLYGRLREYHNQITQHIQRRGNHSEQKPQNKVTLKC